MVYNILVMNNSDENSFITIKTIFKMTTLLLFIGILIIFAILDAPINFEKECIIYNRNR